MSADLAFKPPRQNMTLISESDGRFDELAPQHVKEAVARAERLDGAVGLTPNIGHDATGEEMEERRQQALRREGKTDEKLEKDLGGVIRAKYKIEITFVKTRSLTKPNHVGIQIWESGKRFHGGGDELMYWCKDNRDGHDDGCWSPIPSDNIKGGIAYCSNCKRAVNSDLLTNMKIGNVRMDTLAKELEKVFRSLGSNADFLIKYHRFDVRYVAMERDKGPDVAKRLKGMHIYPLKNILRDTAAGADIVKRIQAFITS